MIKILRSFQQDFNHLPKIIQLKTLKKLALLDSNERHPSLRVKKMKGCEHVWEVWITISYRLTYQREGTELWLRRIGTHDILKTP